ncbi:MAG: hypothetical protein WDM89_15485 [Rhizomicrobium sp.]
MNKLSIGETVRFAYGFTLRELGTIIGLIWVPMVALAVISFLPYALGDTARSPDINSGAAGAIALRSLALSLISILLTACVTVPVLRQAMGLRKGPAFIHVSLGAAELRLWGGYLLLIGITIILMLGLMLAVVTAAVAANAIGSKVLGAALSALIVLAGICAMLYALVRLSFLLGPVVVAENRLTLERGWLLTAGNFWRIVAVLFFVTLPFALVFLGAFVFLLGPDTVALYHRAMEQNMDQQQIADRMQAIVDSHISIILGVQLIIAPFSVGLSSAAAGYAYKILSPGVPASTPRP